MVAGLINRKGGRLMRWKYLVVAVLAGLVCFGCGRDDNKKSSGKVDERPAAVQEHDQVFTQETMEKIGKVAGPVLEKAEKTTSEVATTVVEKTAKARQQTEEFAAALKEESAPVVKKTGAALIVAGEKVQKIAEVMSAPEMVVIDNTNGKVTLPHRAHGKSLGCATCHGDKEPGRIELDKKKAHALCKDCHQREGKGPTNCSGCHEKGSDVMVDGC